MTMYRTFRNPSIWREMDRLQRDMNRLLNRYDGGGIRRAPSYPAMNIWVREDGQFVSAEMPGLSADDIEISVEGDTLMISGERRSDELPEGARCFRQERNFGNFSRTIQLPYEVDANKVEASFSKGVLNIKLPRTEAEKPRKINISA